MNTIIFGTIAFDAIETPYAKTDKIIGGSGTYICFSASYFVRPQTLSAVGYDFPQEFIQKLKDKGVDLDGMQIKQDEKSMFWSCRYFDNMNQRETLTTELNVVEHYNPILPESYKNTEYVMLGNGSPVLQRNVLEQLHHKPKFVALDTMNFWMDTMMDELKKTIAMVDIIIINDEEARQLSDGERCLSKAARKICAMGPRYVIIKKGEHGALLFSKDKIFSAPALPLEDVVDPTGAGDTFAGAFIGYIAQQDKTDFETLKTAVIVASAMASFTVEKMGTEGLENLTPYQIENRILKFKELSEFKI
ncbi:MAG: bifunctional hydroxymethylpyrimidine kinase/phosphomethylpyrimidine kinase [Bacteroidales bacterium]|nr:bifunctional hydroxymethylpyrimidine kinase/phosphomethylpyrimidine kinase [Bacteroidales bacterium]